MISVLKSSTADEVGLNGQAQEVKCHAKDVQTPSWGKKEGWDFSFNFPNWHIARGFSQFIDDQFSLNLNILSISFETRHIHFFLCIVFSLLLPTFSNIFRWLYPQVVPAPQETWPLGPSQALIVTRTCTDGTFANDVALGCAGSSHGAHCPWGKYEKLTAGMIDQSSTVEIILFSDKHTQNGVGRWCSHWTWSSVLFWPV